MFGGEFWIVLVVALAGVGVAYVIAASRKADARTAAPTGRMASVNSPLTPAAAFAKLKSASLGRFKLGDADETRGALVFVSGITPFSWGFFFPVFVFVTAAGSGARVDAGIRSRLFQYGPVVTKTHKEFMSAVEKALAQL